MGADFLIHNPGFLPHTICGGDFMDSVWMETVSLPQFPALRGDRETDVLIIGGGMAGILCAWKLREAGVDCLLLEADRICGGVTAGTTAKITFQHGLCYDKM